MATLSANPKPFRAVVRRHASSLACLLLVLAVLLGTGLERNLPLAVYLLSFWHYYLYWLAFTFGTIPFGTFKRDAMAMKGVSVAALATVYLAAQLDFASLIVIASGILLNVRAAAALGIDRTYYGCEVASLPSQRITAFPYSLIAHPMILGNVAAFAGTLINPEFRERWWPLAALHVALNIGLLVMELAGRRGRPGVGVGSVLAAAGVLLIITLGMQGAAAAIGIWVLYRCYASPDRSPATAPKQATEETIC